LLEEFARAELALRQRKLTESLNHFKDLENKSKDAPLYDDVLMKIGEIQLKLGNSLDAITAFSFIADSLEQCILRDRALMRIAEVYQFALREPVKATRAYEQLLARFPSSLHTSEARKRIRFLRGDAI